MYSITVKDRCAYALSLKLGNAPLFRTGVTALVDAKLSGPELGPDGLLIDFVAVQLALGATLAPLQNADLERPAPRVSNELAPPHLVPARRPQRDGRDRRPVHLRRAPRQDPRAAGPAPRARDQGRDHRAHVGRRGGLLRPRERHGAHLASRKMSRLFENPLPLRETSRAPLSYETPPPY